MAQPYRVTLNLDRIRDNLFVAERKWLMPEEIRDFLMDCGFRPDGNGWIAEELSLDALGPDEIVVITPL